MPWTSTVCPASTCPRGHKCVPGGESCDGQCRRLCSGQCSWWLGCLVLVDDNVFRKQAAVDRPADRQGVLLVAELAVLPVRQEHRRDPIAEIEPCRTVTARYDDTDAVGQGHNRT